MSDKNSITLSGRLVFDPQKSKNPDSNGYLKFRLVSNDYYRLPTGEILEDALFINCKCFGALAASWQGLKKGKMVVVEGRLVLDCWEHNGTKREELVVVCESVTEAPWIPRSGPAQSKKADHPPVVDAGRPPF